MNGGFLTIILQICPFHAQFYPMLDIQSFIFGPFQENTYVLHDQTGQGIVIDPGCYGPEEQKILATYIKDHNIKVTKVVNTHCHIDHVLGNNYVKEAFGVPLCIPKGEDPVFKAVVSYASSYGFPLYKEAEVDTYLDEEGFLEFGDTRLEILFVPGHSPGHLAFYDRDSKACLAGDVLFNGSIGRTDLPGGDHDTLIKSIHDKLFPLGDDIVIYSGHGPTTIIGHEKKTNPFCAIV